MCQINTYSTRCLWYDQTCFSVPCTHINTARYKMQIQKKLRPLTATGAYKHTVHSGPTHNTNPDRVGVKQSLLWYVTPRNDETLQSADIATQSSTLVSKYRREGEDSNGSTVDHDKKRQEMFPFGTHQHDWIKWQSGGHDCFCSSGEPKLCQRNKQNHQNWDKKNTTSCDGDSNFTYLFCI